MTISKQVRTLASASLLALAIASVAAGFADAKYIKDAALCRSQGYVWNDEFGCADSTCVHNGKHYWHGEGYAEGSALYVCNAFTGEFIRFRTAQPQGPQTVHITTTGTNAPPSQTPAYPRTPRGTGTYAQP